MLTSERRALALEFSMQSVSGSAVRASVEFFDLIGNDVRAGSDRSTTE
jgi:hypothetical protein